MFFRHSKKSRRDRDLSLMALYESGIDEAAEAASSRRYSRFSSGGGSTLSPLAPVVVLSDEQFSEVMSCIRQAVAERKHLNESTLAEAETIDRHGGGMVALDDVLAIATGHNTKGEQERTEKVEEQNEPTFVGPTISSRHASQGLAQLGKSVDRIIQEEASTTETLEDNTIREDKEEQAVEEELTGSVEKKESSVRFKDEHSGHTAAHHSRVEPLKDPVEQSISMSRLQGEHSERSTANGSIGQRLHYWTSSKLRGMRQSTQRLAPLTASEKLQRMVSSLNEDTFSFVISAPIMSAPFFTGIVVFLLKTVFYALTLIDLIGNDVAARIPVALEAPVFITQFLALCIAVLTQNDTIVALKLLYEGFGRGVAGSGINDSFPYATYPKWLCAVLLLLLEGLLGLLATLFLTITSKTIIDVLLNFAAVEFISSLDDAAFFLSSIGYLGRGNRLEAEVVANTAYLIPHKVQPMYQIGLLLVILVSTIVSWISVAVLQLQGAFATGSFYVQFDDDVRDGIQIHNGIYTLAKPPMTAGDFFLNRGRFRYNELEIGGGKIDYCYGLGAWTFFTEGNDPCENILAMADPLNTFDIIETSTTPWLILKEDSSSFVPQATFYLDKICVSADDCNGNDCNADGYCDCEAEFVGPRCDFNVNDLCPRLILDELTSKTFVARRHLATTYDLAIDVTTNETVSFFDRPVYFNNGTWDMIVYTGLRWIVVNPTQGFQGTFSYGVLMEAFRTGVIQRSIVDWQVDAVSEPVYYNSAQDSSTPAGREWFAVLNNAVLRDAQLSSDRLSTSLICERCDDTLNPCKNDNLCGVDGTCQCRHGETGSHCQVLPTGDGQCNRFFNTPVYDYDRGDCCGLTCTDETKFPCGSITIEGDVFAGLGYPHCVSPSLTSHCTEEQHCYIRGSSIVKQYFASPSYINAIALWYNGQLAVVGEQGQFSTIRVQGVSGNTFEEYEQVEFVSSFFQVAIATMPGNVLRSSAGTIPRGILAHHQGSSGIAVSLRGTAKQSLTQQPPIRYSDFGILDSVACSDGGQLGTGSSLTQLRDRVELSMVVGVILDDFCAKPSSGANVTRPPPRNTFARANASFATSAEDNTHIFWMTTSQDTWQHVAAGRWHDLAMSGNGLYVALHDKSLGVGENITLLHGVVSRDQDFSALLSFSLKEALSGLLDANSTTFASMDDMHLSHDGHDLSVAVSALNTATQERFGFVARIKMATRNVFQPMPLYPVVPVAFLDTFPAFTDHRSELPCRKHASCDAVAFSGDGTSFAFVTDTPSDTDRIDVYTTEKNYGLQYLQWKSVGSFFASDHSMNYIRKFGLSHDGNILIVSDEDGMAKFELREPCLGNETVLYLSIVLDARSTSVSWRLESLLGVDGMTYARSVVRDCERCYPGHGYSQSTVVEKVCVPREMASCLGLSVEISETSTTTSVVAFFDNNTVADPVIFFEGEDEGSSENGFFLNWRSPSCANTVVRSCAVSDPLYVQSLSFTRLEGSMWWSVHSTRTGMVAMNSTVTQKDLSNVDSSVYNELCVAADDCWALSFGGGSYELSYVMSVFDGREVSGSGFVMRRRRTPSTLYFGACGRI